ncbi:MAG: cellulose biosynthesis cyclic di-GMP-binding regulatory protein BcsB [Anaerolineae bacterium]|nr:cellulose biosynthesis cyclic di-GMP-binding regulatory protein BcsB [Anaerolineae bacterium]
MTTRPASTAPRIYLPPNILRVGENQLGFRSEAVHRDACVLDGSGLWMNIRSDTRVHILTRTDTSDPSARQVNLNGYLNSLTSRADLSNIAFVLGTNDAGGWNAAAKLASGLGAQFDPKIAQRPINMAVAYSDALPEETRTQREVIAVGKASTLLGVMDELNNVLPAPFPQGGDFAIERDAPLQYRAPAEADIGYVQLLLAPWNPRHSVLAIMGSTDAGILSASSALLDPKTRSQISGNLVFVSGEQLVVTDNQRALARAVAAGTAIPTAAIAPAAQPTVQPAGGPPTWIASVLAVTIGALLFIGAVVAFAVISRRRKKIVEEAE